MWVIIFLLLTLAAIGWAVWALRVLHRPEIREAFRANLARTPSFGWPLLAAWVSLLALPIFAVVYATSVGHQLRSIRFDGNVYQSLEFKNVALDPAAAPSVEKPSPPAPPNPPPVEKQPPGSRSRLELAAISKNPSSQERWWKPDGAPTEILPGSTVTTAPEFEALDGEQVREFGFFVGNSKDDITQCIFDPPAKSYSTSSGLPGTTYRTVVALLPKTADLVTIKAAVRNGWERVAEYQVSAGTQQSLPAWDLHFFKAFKAQNGTKIAVDLRRSPDRKRQTRLIATDVEGKEHLGAAEPNSNRTYFADLELSRIGTIRLEASQDAWFEFKAVLNPDLSRAPAAAAPKKEILEPPRLRFISWQGERSRAGSLQVWYPDGKPVVESQDLKWLRETLPPLTIAREPNAPPRSAPCLTLWFSCPSFDGRQYARVSVPPFDSDWLGARPNYDSKSGQFNLRYFPPTAASGNTGWISVTFFARTLNALSPSFSPRLYYTDGPWDEMPELLPPGGGPVGAPHISPRSRMDGTLMMGVEEGERKGEIRVGIWRTSDNILGKTFAGILDSQYDFVAVTHWDREVEYTIPQQGLSFYPVPLSQVKGWKVRKRHIKSITFPDIPLAAAMPWGPPNLGLRAHAVPLKPVWGGGKPPAFEIDLHNANDESERRQFTVRDCQVQVNGVRYRWVAGPAPVKFPAPEYLRPPLGPDDVWFDFLPVELIDGWVPSAFGKEKNPPWSGEFQAGAPLKLTPGKHTVQFVLLVESARPTATQAEVFTNPVEIEILDPGVPDPEPRTPVEQKKDGD